MITPQSLLVGTQNEGKLKELRELLSDLPLKLRGLTEFPKIESVPETGESFSPPPSHSRQRRSLKPLISRSRWLAVRIKRGVADRFGVFLRPEPIFVGLDHDPEVTYLQSDR